MNCLQPLIQNQLQKQTRKQNIYYLKIKLNQVSVIALPGWELLRQVSENAILPVIN